MRMKEEMYGDLVVMNWIWSMCCQVRHGYLPVHVRLEGAAIARDAALRQMRSLALPGLQCYLDQ